MGTAAFLSLPRRPPLKERLGRIHRASEPWVDGSRTATQALIRAYLRTVHRLEIHGRDRLPAEGSYVLVANHSSHFDALCLEAATPFARRHRVFAAAAADYFFTRTVTSVGAVVGVNAVPMDRRGGRGAECLRRCRELLLQEPTVLILFPEGTRAPDGKLGRFRSGVGRLVSGTDLPVVPCFLEGAHGAWPKGRLLPRPNKLDLHVGEPRTSRADPDDFPSVQAFVEELRRDVESLGRG